MAMERQTRVERRLAAILAADVAGYSRLMGLDEVGTAQVLREHRGVVDALVAKHGGRIVKTTGDGLLIEFHSVVDAVECALAIQAVMADRNEGVPADRRMPFRVGIKRVRRGELRSRKCPCVYRKLKLGHNGDAVRQGSRGNGYFQLVELGARKARPYLASDAFAIHYNRRHRRLESGAGALRPV
jgi:hypothetical protein